jgi:hypothetical protein
MSAQEPSLLGRRGMPLGAASHTGSPLRSRRYAQWERRPRALDVQETPPALPVLDEAPVFDDFDRDGDAMRRTRDSHRDRQEPSPRPNEAGPQAQAAAALPVLRQTPRDAAPPAPVVSTPMPRDEPTAIPVPPAIRPTLTPAEPVTQRVLRTEAVTRTVEKRVPGDTVPAFAPIPRPTASPSEVRIERQPFGIAMGSPATPAVGAASMEPAAQTAVALVQRIERLVLSPTSAPPSPSAEPQDATQQRDGAPTPTPQTLAPRRAFGRATVHPPPAAPKAVSLDLLRGTAEPPALSIGSLHVVVKPPAPPLPAVTAATAAQPGQPQPPTAPTPARPARSAYRNPWFAARRVE